MVTIRPFRLDDAQAVIALWSNAGLTRPWNDPQRDIERKLAQQADGFLVALDDAQRLVGSVMAGYDGHRGWVNYLAVAHDARHRGIGRALMQAAEVFVRSLGAPKLNLQLREGNVAAALFYERLGYHAESLHSYGKRFVADGAAAPAAPDAGTLVLASRNKKKLAEMQALLAPRGYTLRLVSEFSDEEPEETGASFVENALIKARHAARVSGLPAIADDSGLEVAALGGAPGVRSARYAGEPSDDGANNSKLLAALADVPDARRGARFVSVLARLHHADDPVPLLAQGFWPGRILREPRGTNGFGYDPLFFVPELARSAAELPAELKNRVSHRARAMQSLLAQL